jgi:hypothetical protein
MTEETLCAVVTGDIVESRRFMDQGPALRDSIKDAYSRCNEAFDEALGGLPPVDVFAGDSWQIMVRRPSSALRVGLCMRALIKSDEQLAKADTRLAIGIGDADFIEEEDLSESQGEAFTLSGEALAALQDARVRIAVRGPAAWAAADGPFEPQATVDAMMALLDALCQDWTPSQSAVVAEALMGLGQERVGERLSISQPAVSQALRASNWQAVEQAIQWWERSQWRRL